MARPGRPLRARPVSPSSSRVGDEQPSRRTPLKIVTPGRVAGLAVGLCVLLAATAVGGCSETAAVDKVGLYYTGGPFQGQHFEKVVQPGSGATWMGIQDKLVWLPAGQRNYIVSKKDTEGDQRGVDFLRVPAKQGVEMDLEISVYFKLNTHTNDIQGFKGGTLRRFYEQICKKYECDSEDGWDNMLNDNFRKIIEAAVRSRVFNYTVDELFANAEGAASGTTDAIDQIQNDIAKQLKVLVNSTLGGEFFCGPTFEREKTECPDFQFVINSAAVVDEGIKASYAKQKSTANETVSAKNEGAAAVERANATRAQQDALRGQITPEYLRLQEIEATRECAKNPNCTLIVGGAGNVNVNTGRTP